MYSVQEKFENVKALFFLASNGIHQGSITRLGFGPPNMESGDKFRGSDAALVISIGRAFLLKGRWVN